MRLHQKDRSYENWAFSCKIYNFILNQSNAEVSTIQESVKPKITVYRNENNIYHRMNGCTKCCNISCRSLIFLAS